MARRPASRCSSGETAGAYPERQMFPLNVPNALTLARILLVPVVSLNRVAAWVAMVIIAREFAVSGLRIAAGQQGVVIPASPLGRAKTVAQVAAILAVIASGRPTPVWASVLLYVAVAITLA